MIICEIEIGKTVCRATIKQTVGPGTRRNKDVVLEVVYVDPGYVADPRDFRALLALVVAKLQTPRGGTMNTPGATQLPFEENGRSRGNYGPDKPSSD